LSVSDILFSAGMRAIGASIASASTMCDVMPGFGQVIV
jgi:hypothetical protein